MQFSTTLALAALSIGSAIAQSNMVNVHVVTVGSSNGTLTYCPNKVVAAAGDMVQFQFMPKNHTVTQSNFDNPCEPIDMHSNLTGVYSGFMPVAPGAMSIPTYTILVNNTKPMWIYCSQGKHCQAGMSMVINENTTANSTRSLTNYQALAKMAPANLAPGMPADGSSGITYASATTMMSMPSMSATASSSAAASNSTTITKTNGAQAAVRVPEVVSLVGVVALGFALFL